MDYPHPVYHPMLLPRDAWLFRLMERAGVDPRRAKSMPWFDNDRDHFTHHAEYLQRLSKLREELVSQEHVNLANALERLHMRSYGREYIFSRPKPKGRHSRHNETQKRKSLITTFERFQRMRPKRSPPLIMPLEGKQLLEPTEPEKDRVETKEQPTPQQLRKSVNESVRINLERLVNHNASIPSINRNASTHRDIVVENYSKSKTYSHALKKNSSHVGNGFHIEDRNGLRKSIRQPQWSNRQGLEDMILAPQSFQRDKNVNDRMPSDYYCVYYIPAPSPAQTEDDSTFMSLPSLPTSSSMQSDDRMGRHSLPPDMRYYDHTALPQIMDFSGSINSYPVSTCNESCPMFVSGNKVESHSHNHLDVNDELVSPASYRFENKVGRGKKSNTNGRKRSEHTTEIERGSYVFEENGRKQIVVSMPAIVFNAVQTSDDLKRGPPSPEPSKGSLLKAFKKKEIRQRELTNLLEDVKELNKRTESLTEAAASHV
ncbi:hypothetical protein CHS0354_037004 [Potamilus streckersoni]|uniref:Uncharacterized protein n=1 Tax=Potamilus streckersoni TaxID=2493646 RepID=A0AAE0SK06_9BIVA|nr:hypothetical protein CHS0354_037004 [Potamilus streckersoni]